MKTIDIDIDGSGAATVTLDRPAVHNAFDETLIGELSAALGELAGDERVRAVVLAARGKSFSAGADLDWMRRMAGNTRDTNLADANALGRMLARLDTMPKPTLARVQGAVYGGGVGLVACCDIAIAARRAVFCLAEVKLGLIPATISPYVVEAIGARAARRYFQTAEPFDAAEAHRLGLVHEVVADDALDATVGRLVAALADAGPEALAESKRLVALVKNRPVDDGLIAETARRIAERRASDEAREGVSAFLEKRDPAWRLSRG